MSRKTPKKSKSPNHKSPSIGRHDILDADGIKTSGLTGASRISLKELGKHKVATQPNLKPQLEQEKERAAQIRNLLDSIHPGSTAPEGVSFSGINFSGKDLERVRFSENTLKGCIFRHGILRDSHWKDCDLSGVDFREADLRDCIFDGCNLNGADLRHANLKNSRIIDCNLFAANFDNAMLDKAVIDHCEMGAQSFHNASCKELSFYSSHIIHGFFDNADMTGAELRNIMFRNCTLTNTRFQNSVIEDCVFRGCDSFQEGPIFSGSKMHKVVMMDCEFTASRMVETQLSHCHWERVDMNSALFDGTLFNEVNFQESVLKSCYTLDIAPIFNRCKLDHSIIEQTDLAAAKFNQSSFVSSIIRDSDFSGWELLHTGLDADTVIESLD
ncbi:hypothetical protein ACH42_08185 [Endozoicomonas sp. (ex Bugula neritina AB1)]|nr:hypothetical protein ACH42_08185 [Endozoicomonas sp. (ex Bugula neritina AB1)]